jgi:hypothetical protein
VKICRILQNISVALYEGRKAERDSTINTFLQVRYLDIFCYTKFFLNTGILKITKV